MAKKAIFKMAVAAILNSSKIAIFGHVTVTGFNIWCSVPNFIKIGDFSLRYGDLTIFKMTAVCHLGFYTYAFLSHSPCQHAILLSHTKFRWNRTCNLSLAVGRTFASHTKQQQLRFADEISDELWTLSGPYRCHKCYTGRKYMGHRCWRPLPAP